MSYVNVYVAAVPEENREKYLDMAKTMDSYFKEKGATRVVECWGKDVPDGKLTSFPMAVKAEEGEAIVFGWIEWSSKEDSDMAMQAMMSDPQFSPDKMQMPFDGKRMIFAGFEKILDM